jgi:outer membrane assembly lipoprotein YfgL
MKRWLISGTPAVAVLALALSACSSTPDKPKPTELVPVTNSLNVKQAWSVALPAGRADFETAVAGNEVVLAAENGSIARLDVANGQVVARAEHDRKFSAAVGADEQFAAAVDIDNQLVVFRRDGSQAWTQRMPAYVTTAPLVSRGSVLVLAADQSVHSFDAQTGARQWVNTRAVPTLLLKRAGGLVLDGETVYVGLAQGRLAAINFVTGATRWEQAVVSARGTNEVERLTDVVGIPTRADSDICARAFQGGVTCVTATNGRGKWIRNAQGTQPVQADARAVIATDGDGTVNALARSNGEPTWSNDQFKHRDLSAPALAGNAAVFGDFQGFVHFLSRDNGSIVARMATDGSAIANQPVTVGKTVVVRTRNSAVGLAVE